MREMKDSGIEWIGKIPLNWICSKQKYALSLLNGRAFSDTEFLGEGKYRVLRVGNIFTNPVWYYSNLKLDDSKYCDKGDLLYTWSMSYAPVIWTGEKVIYHYHIWKVLPRKFINKRFAFYYLQALTLALKSEIHETTMGFITMGIMNNAYIAYGSLKEQQAIANFLDAKCADIDSLTADIQKQINILKEYKKSVITQAVTKGIDPNVEMKDSGIAWIGKIPKNWEIKKIKNVICNDKDGLKIGPFGSALANKTIADGAYNIYGQANLVNDDFSYTKNTINKNTFHILKSYQVLPNDICLSMMGTIGKCKTVPVGIKEGIMDSHLIKIRLDKTQIISKFFEYVYDKDRSNICITEMQYVKKGSIMDGLNTSIVKNLRIVVPLISDQQAIVDFLDAKCADIDAAIAGKQKQLDVLKEYKKSLIYEYVTGKKEVPCRE